MKMALRRWTSLGSPLGRAMLGQFAGRMAGQNQPFILFFFLEAQVACENSEFNETTIILIESLSFGESVNHQFNLLALSFMLTRYSSVYIA